MTSNRRLAAVIACLLLASNVQIVIVATGWDEVARVEGSVAGLTDRVEIRVLSTPEAFATYNSLVAEGRSVVLIAHTTC